MATPEKQIVTALAELEAKNLILAAKKAETDAIKAAKNLILAAKKIEADLVKAAKKTEAEATKAAKKAGRDPPETIRSFMSPYQR